MEFEKAAETYREIKSFDPLLVAEELCGGDTSQSRALGFMMHLSHSHLKRKLLETLGDSHLQISLVEFLQIASKFGFEEIYLENFPHYRYKTTEVISMETLRFLWNPLGLLLKVESYGEGVNSAEVWFNWKSSKANKVFPSGLSISGGAILKDPKDFDSEILGLSGHFDCREGFISTLTELAIQGSFKSKWIREPNLWLANFTEAEVAGFDIDLVNKTKIAQFPKHVIEAISVEEN